MKKRQSGGGGRAEMNWSNWCMGCSWADYGKWRDSGGGNHMLYIKSRRIGLPFWRLEIGDFSVAILYYWGRHVVVFLQRQTENRPYRISRRLHSGTCVCHTALISEVRLAIVFAFYMQMQSRDTLLREHVADRGPWNIMQTPDSNKSSSRMAAIFRPSVGMQPCNLTKIPSSPSGLKTQGEMTSVTTANGYSPIFFCFSPMTYGWILRIVWL